MQNSNQPITKIEITQDKLVDILLHAATREDLANLAKESKGNFEQQRAEAKAEFEKMRSETKAEFDKLDFRIDKLDSRIDKLDAKIDKLTWFIIAGILIPIVLHFIK